MPTSLHFLHTTFVMSDLCGRCKVREIDGRVAGSLLSVLCSHCCSANLMTATCAKAMLGSEIDKLKYTFRGGGKRWYLRDEVGFLAEPIQARKAAAGAAMQARRTAARNARVQRLPVAVHTVPADLLPLVMGDYARDDLLKPYVLLKQVLQVLQLVPVAIHAAELIFTELDCASDARKQVLRYLAEHPHQSAEQATEVLMHKTALLQQIAQADLVCEFLTNDEADRLCAAVPAFAVQRSVKGRQLREALQKELAAQGLVDHACRKRVLLRQEYCSQHISLQHAVKLLLETPRIFRKRADRRQLAKAAVLAGGREITQEITTWIEHFACCGENYTVEQFIASL